MRHFRPRRRQRALGFALLASRRANRFLRRAFGLFGDGVRTLERLKRLLDATLQLLILSFQRAAMFFHNSGSFLSRGTASLLRGGNLGGGETRALRFRLGQRGLLRETLLRRRETSIKVSLTSLCFARGGGGGGGGAVELGGGGLRRLLRGGQSAAQVDGR